MQRLQSRKAEVTGQIDQLKAATRFEPQETPVSLDVLEKPATPIAAGDMPAAPSLAEPAKPQAESYTERLLKAKKKVWEERK